MSNITHSVKKIALSSSLNPANLDTLVYKTTDGEWTNSSQSTSGYVIGPESSTVNAIATFADTSGVLLNNNSSATVDSTGDIHSPGLFSDSLSSYTTTSDMSVHSGKSVKINTVNGPQGLWLVCTNGGGSSAVISRSNNFSAIDFEFGVTTGPPFFFTNSKDGDIFCRQGTVGNRILLGTGSGNCTVIVTDNNTNSTSTTTGALQVLGGVGIENDTYIGGSIYLPTTGGIQSPFNYYEENISYTTQFSCGGTPSATIALRFCRVGKLVTMFIPTFSLTSGSLLSPQVVSSIVMPTQFRPFTSSSPTTLGTCMMVVAGVTSIYFVMHNINNSIVIENTNNGNFPTGASIQLFQHCCCSWTTL